MAATIASTAVWNASISKANWRALVASWLGWMFDGYETWALVLVMMPAVRQLLSPERLPKASIYAGGLLTVTLLGWARAEPQRVFSRAMLAADACSCSRSCATPFLQG